MKNCTIIDCMNPAQWIPILFLSPNGRDHLRGEVSGLHVCDRHKALLDVAHFIDEKSGRQIVAAMSKVGLSRPKLEYSRIEWREL